MKFNGDFKDLMAIVAITGSAGTWSGTDPHDYRATDGAILKWWPSTKTVLFQGPPAARDKLKSAVIRAIKQRALDQASAEKQSTGSTAAPQIASAPDRAVYIVKVELVQVATVPVNGEK